MATGMADVAQAGATTGWRQDGQQYVVKPGYGHPTIMVDGNASVEAGPSSQQGVGRGVIDVVGWIAFVVVLVYVVWSLARTARQVQQFEEGVVLRLGRYVRTVGPGLRLVIPFVEKMTKVDRRESAISIGGQEALSKDNVPVKMTVVVWTRITDARRSVTEIEDARGAVQKVALTSLVTAIGKNDLDHLLKERDAISTELKATIDAVTEQWGYEVTRVAIQNVEIPESMQRAMAAVAEAGRRRDALVIEADGEFQASARLADAGRMLAASPGSLDLRRLQTMSQIGAEQNSTIILTMPMEFLRAADALAGLAGTAGGATATPAASREGATGRTSEGEVRP